MYRCCNPNSVSYRAYGGRGITVCERWRQSFEDFLADMGEVPDGYSIERIDVNGNYEPSNCKWIPISLQYRNKQTTEFFDYHGARLMLSEIAHLMGVELDALSRRVKGAGMAIDQAIHELRLLARKKHWARVDANRKVRAEIP